MDQRETRRRALGRAHVPARLPRGRRPGAHPRSPMTYDDLSTESDCAVCDAMDGCRLLGLGGVGLQQVPSPGGNKGRLGGMGGGYRPCRRTRDAM